MTHINRFAVLSGVLLSAFATSCVNEVENELTPVAGGEGYYISLTGDINKNRIDTRAHWDINTEDQSLAFAWDNSSNEMKSFVWRSNVFVDFKEGKKYSATTVTPTDNVAELNITDGLSQEYAQGDIIWAVSPLKETNIGTDNKVTFTLPDGFTQDKLNSTEHLKPYILMSGTGTVDGENKANIAFDVLSAIYRFKIVNNESTELIVNEVSVSGPFCDKAELSMNGTVTALYSISNGASYTIKVSTPTGGLKVDGNGTAYLYALVFPTETSSKNDNITLSFKGKYGNSNVIVNKTKVCNTVYPDKDLESNTYYDMVVPVSSSDINEDVVIEDYPKMYLADVDTDEELNSDIFGVPMVINRTAENQYEARYYNKTANTGIYFIPRKESFGPICFGAGDNIGTLAYGSSTADVQPIVLETAGVYYKINIDTKNLTYSTETYTIDEALNPMPDKFVDDYGTATVDFWDEDNGEWIETFFIGFGCHPKTVWDERRKFVQDETNKHIFYYPADNEIWHLDEGIWYDKWPDGGTGENILITMPHGGGWWDRIEWRNDAEVERFGYYNKTASAKDGSNDYISTAWKDNGWNMKFDDGTTVTDIKFQINVTEAGNYRFEFDSHLGRAKLVKVND